MLQLGDPTGWSLGRGDGLYDRAVDLMHRGWGGELPLYMYVYRDIHAQHCAFDVLETDEALELYNNETVVLNLDAILSC